MSQPHSTPASTIGMGAIIISVLLHSVVVAGVVYMGSFSLSFSAPPQQDMLISISDARLPMQNLPPLGTSQDAGPVQTSPPPTETNPAVTEIQEPELQEETQPEVEKPVEQPKPETQKPDPVQQKPVEKQVEKPVEKPEEKPVEQPADRQVASTNPVRTPEREPEPDPEPTAQEIADELKQQRGTRSRTFNTTGGGTATGLISPQANNQGVSSGPALYTSNLTQLIGGAWQPPVYPPGEVRDCTVEFTIYSPPLESGAVNQNRVARVMNIKIVESSGDAVYDQRAIAAVQRVRTWPPPPSSYKNETLTVTCRFYLVGDQ